MKNGMSSLPAALKESDIFITLEISSSEIDNREGILAGYEALGISVRSAFGMGVKKCDFRASAFPEGVVAMPERVIRLGIVGEVRGT
jgi:hypothetical protein